MANIKGVWIFNETIECINTNTTVSVNFTSNGYSYTTMTCRNKDYAWSITYEPASPYNTVGYYATNGWVYALTPPTSVPEIRTVDFGETEQTVPDVFYEWFTSNAIKQSIPEKYSIEKSTLTSFADQARRIGSTTELLTPSQMLEIFENAKVNGTLDGLANGYDVMFYDENNEGLAFYSIKSGQAINPPMYSVSNWIDQDGVAIVFPYTPTADITLWADNSTLSALLYDHFAVSPEEYPYIVIDYRLNGASNASLFGFAKTLTISNGSPSYTNAKSTGWTTLSKLTSPTIEELVEIILANYTADNLTAGWLTYQKDTSYTCYVNHSLSDTTVTNWEQFE